MKIGCQLFAVHYARHNRLVNRDYRNAELLGVLPNKSLIGAHGGRFVQDAGRRTWNVFQALVGAEDADELLHFVVVRRQFGVGDGPVNAQTIAAFGFEVIRAHAQRDPAPMVGAPAEHASSPPFEVGALGTGVRFSRNAPATVYC